ncbi:UvrD-like helicase family protein [Cytobacillus horneckiae]
MKTALHNEQIINLYMLNREDYQQIFDYAKRGNLQCPDCLGSVKLYLGIEHEPYFYHTQPSNKSCQEAEIPNGSDLTEPEVIERNGFIMPVSRSITLVEASPKTNFKKAVSVKNIPVFINQEFNKNQVDSSYLSKLLECGIRLDEKQAAAVLNTEGSLLVLAGAGSGKTRVLTARTAYMVIEKEIDPQSIMLVTFTAKAAAEMKERLLQYPFMTRSNVQKIVSGTFHSIFYRILSFHSPQRWNNQKLLNKEWQRLQILKNAGRDIHLDEKQFAYDLAIQQISFWKNSLLTPDDIHTKDDWEEKVKYIYQKYEEEKSKKGLFDFDDMLLGCYELFKNEPAILENYQN